MKVALKEWAVVIEALAAGRQIFLLRKGGIAEGKRGFELKHSRFLLFPTWEHQQEDSLQPHCHDMFRSLRPADPDRIEFRVGAEVADILRAPSSIDLLRQASDLHVWNERYLRMRYDYRPDLPLYVVITRAFRLPEAVSVPADRRYAGCRSWVDLYRDTPEDGAAAVLSEAEFATARKQLTEALGRSEF